MTTHSSPTRRVIVAMSAITVVACSRERAAPRAPEAVPEAPSRSVLADSDTKGPPMNDSLFALMAAIEDSLRARPDEPASARLYLRLGRLKSGLGGGVASGSPIGRYLKAHPEEYRYNDPDADYIYTGYQFRELVRRFPRSEYADSAAWELTQLPWGGECEGYVPCYIGRQFDPIADFLRQYPTSPFASDGVRHANEAFTTALADIPDLSEPSEQFPPDTVQAMLARYDTIAEGLPPPLRASAAVTIADLWARFLRYDRARVLYREVLASAAPGLDTSDIRRRLRALPAGALRLRPAEVVNDRRVELTWVRPSTDTVQAYVVYRARSRDSAGERLAQLTPADAPSYSDRTVRPGTEYWYRVKARTGSGELISNQIHTTVASDTLYARALVLSPVDHLLYIFGYLENGFPRVYQVSQTGEVRATFDGAFYGLEHYAAKDHRWDSYMDEAWFVDVTGQQFLRFPRSPSGFGDDVREATHAGWDLVSVDTATMPYYGVVVAVNAAGRQMWVAQGDRAYAISCDQQANRCWQGREGGIWVVDAAGKTIKEIALPRISSAEAEFVTAIQANPGDHAAWAFLSRKGALIRVDSAGAISKSVPLQPFIGGPPPLAFDLRRGWVWSGAGGQLIKLGLDGKELARLTAWRGPMHLAPDTAAGALWVLAGARLLKLNRDGNPIVDARLPVR